MRSVKLPTVTGASSGKPLNVPDIAALPVLSMIVNEVPWARLVESIAVTCSLGWFTKLTMAVLTLSLVAELVLNSTL